MVKDFLAITISSRHYDGMNKIALRADVLRRHATRKNQTLGDLAAYLAVDLSYLHRLMRGEHEPSPKLRRRLCERLGCDFDDLFAYETSQRAGVTSSAS